MARSTGRGAAGPGTDDPDAAPRQPIRTEDGEIVDFSTAVSVAGLALIDMVKAIDPAAVITDVRVESKDGGKTGHWERPR